MYTAAVVYHLLDLLAMTVNIRNVCVLLAPWMAGNTGACVCSFFYSIPHPHLLCSRTHNSGCHVPADEGDVERQRWHLRRRLHLHRAGYGLTLLHLALWPYLILVSCVPACVSRLHLALGCRQLR